MVWCFLPFFWSEGTNLKYLSFANSEGGPKRLKSDSCEAEGEDRGGERGGREGGRKGEDDCYSKLFRPCVGLTVRILLCSVRKYTEWTLCYEVVCLSVCLSICHTHVLCSND